MSRGEWTFTVVVAMVAGGAMWLVLMWRDQRAYRWSPSWVDGETARKISARVKSGRIR